MKNFNYIFLITFILFSNPFLLADERAPNDQCYIVISEKILWSNALSIDIAKAIKNTDIDPKYIEVYQVWSDGERYESYFVTTGKTYKETWNINKNIFPSGATCSSGKGYMSNKMYYVAQDYSLKESKVRSSRNFLASSDDYETVVTSYTKILAEKTAEEARIRVEIKAAEEAKRLAAEKKRQEDERKRRLEQQQQAQQKKLLAAKEQQEYAEEMACIWTLTFDQYPLFLPFRHSNCLWYKAGLPNMSWPFLNFIMLWMLFALIKRKKTSTSNISYSSDAQDGVHEASFFEKHNIQDNVNDEEK